jgi:hypothetical protein
MVMACMCLTTLVGAIAIWAFKAPTVEPAITPPQKPAAARPLVEPAIATTREPPAPLLMPSPTDQASLEGGVKGFTSSAWRVASADDLKDRMIQVVLAELAKTYTIGTITIGEIRNDMGRDKKVFSIHDAANAEIAHFERGSFFGCYPSVTVDTRVKERQDDPKRRFISPFPGNVVGSECLLDLAITSTMTSEKAETATDDILEQLDDYSSAGIDDPKLVQAEVRDLKAAVANDDIAKLCTLVYFPLDVGAKRGNMTIRSPKSLRKHYREIFTDQVKKAILDSPRFGLFNRWTGVTIARGTVWMNQIDKTVLVGEINVDAPP